MALPNIRVYIRPDSIFVVGGTAILGSQQLGTTFQLGAPAGAFVELTSYVQQVSIRRGRTRVTDTFDAGTASITIFDKNAIFSPDNALSPLYIAGVSYVKPLRQIRITALFNNVEYDLFNGYTNSYEYQYEQGIKAGRVTITATDAFRLLNLANITSIIPTVAYEPSGTRLGKLLTQIGIPNGLQSVETGDSVVGPDPTGSRSALEAIQQIESTELGAFFIRADGVMTFKARHTVQQLASGAITTPLVFNEATTTRINLVSNPSFESGTTGWASAQTSTRSTAFAFAGNASFKTTMTATGDTNIGYVTVTPTATGAHTFSVYVFTPTSSTLAGRTVTLSVEGGTATSSLVSSTSATLVAGQWSRVVLTRNVTVVGTMIFVARVSGDMNVAVARTNLVPYPSFESGTTGWTALNGATITSVSNRFAFGGKSIEGTAGSPGSFPGMKLSTNLVVTAGQTYTLSGYFKYNNNSSCPQLQITYSDLFNTYIPPQFTAPLVTLDPTAGWIQQSVTATAPAGAFQAEIRVVFYNSTGAPAGYKWDIDAIMFEQVPAVGPYFDGSTNPDASWTGTAHASTSTLIAQSVYLDGAMFERSSTANNFIEGTVSPAIPFTAISQSLDDEAVYNDVTVTSQAGVQQIATDATSISTYFTRSLEKSSTLISSTAEAGDHALFLLNYRKDPELYIDSIDLQPMALPTATAISLLTAEILDPITVTKSYGSSAEIKRTLTIQGVDHDIRPSDWTMTFSTAEPVSGDGFILDSATYGVLDVNTLSF